MALSALVIALAVSPASALVQGDVDEARALIDEARYDDAITLLNSALEANQGDAELLLALAEAQRQAGRSSAAIATLDSIGETTFDVAYSRGLAYRGRAAESASRGNAEDASFYSLDAKTHLEDALGLAPADDHRARVELGFLNLYDLNDHSTALKLAEEGLAQSPENASLKLLRGCAGVYSYYYATQRGDETAAHEAWKASVEDLLAANKGLSKDRIEPLGQLCYMYDQKGLPNKAVDAAIDLYDRQPTLDTLYHYAYSYSYSKQLEAAAKALEKIVSVSALDLTTRIRNDPNSNETALNMHFAIEPLMNRGDAGTARSILQAIIAADPQVPLVWNNYAVVCDGSQRPEDALKAYERSLEIDPNQARAHNDLAAILHHSLDRDLDRAKDLYQRCIDLAEEQLSNDELELTAAVRADLNQARQVARDNLSGLKPKSSLLDSMLEGVRKLDLPDVDDEEDTSGAP